MATTAEPLFDRAGWWEPCDRAFASLRAVSAFRLDLLRQWLGDDWRGRAVVDLGCGGGLLAVPLAREGAHVVGLDLAPKALRAAAAQQSERLLAAQADLAELPLGAEHAPRHPQNLSGIGETQRARRARQARRGDPRHLERDVRPNRQHPAGDGVHETEALRRDRRHDWR